MVEKRLAGREAVWKDLITLLSWRNQQLQLNISMENRVLCLTGAPLRRASLFATRNRWPSGV